MLKGTPVVLKLDDGTIEDKGYYVVDTFTDNEGVKVHVLGGMSEDLLFIPEEHVKVKIDTTDQQNTMNVLVDLVGAVKYLTSRIELLIPKCPECGEDLHCGRPPHDEEDEDDDLDDLDCDGDCGNCDLCDDDEDNGSSNLN